MAKEPISVLIDRVDRLEKELLKNAINIAEELALNAKALIVKSIQEKGINGEAYSDNGIPGFFLYNKAINQNGRNLIKEKQKKKELISWKEFREAQGLQTDHVDLTYTGRMFQNIGIIDRKLQGTKGVAYLGGFDQEVKNKLMWNRERYGDFLNLTEEDKRLLNQIAETKIKRIVTQLQLV